MLDSFNSKFEVLIVKSLIEYTLNAAVLSFSILKTPFLVPIQIASLWSTNTFLILLVFI